MTELSTTRRDGKLVLELRVTRLVADCADRLKAAMKAAIDPDEPAVIIDLRSIEFIDSSGIGAIVGVRKHMGRTADLALANPQNFVAKVLRLTRIDRAIPVLDGSMPGAV